MPIALVWSIAKNAKGRFLSTIYYIAARLADAILSSGCT